jgi:type II secretory ATPase GspE/PulE/Tfp pilus assembly ATPase PilB-like protein
LKVPKKIFNATGCDKCGFYGYQGRIGIFEIARIEPDIVHMIADGIHQKQLRDYLRKIQINPMLVDGLNKVSQGITSLEELYRVCDIKIED